MDPITTVITTALIAGAAAGISEAGKQAILDAYGALKAVIVSKFGLRNDLSDAITSLEDKPESPGRQATLEEEVNDTGADQDAEILAAVKALREKLESYGDERIQRMVGSEGGEQIMRGKGGRQEQDMSDSPSGKQLME